MIKYLTGNHDIFAYNYLRTQDMLRGRKPEEILIHIAGRDLAHLIRNGGETTLESLDNFENER